jgi:hypothetical protein
MGYKYVAEKKNGNKVDGCGTFFKQDRMKLISNYKVSYYKDDF